MPFDNEDADYFSHVQEALQTNFAFSSEDGHDMHTFGEHPSNDYTGPPLTPEDEQELSSEDEDEFEGPYATADQVAQKEKKYMQEHLKASDDGFSHSSLDTESNKSSTYVSSDSVRAKKRQDRLTSLNRNATSKIRRR